MHRIAIFIFLASPSFVVDLAAQDLHVHFDVFRDSIYYQLNGKSISAPTVRDGKNVILHIENYNNYLYDVAVEVENTEIQVATATAEGGLTSLLPMGGAGKTPFDMLFSGGSDNMLGGLTKMFPVLSGKDVKEGGSGWGTAPEEIARQEEVVQLKKTKDKFDQVMEMVSDLDADLGAMEEKAESILTSNRLQRFAASEVAHLRFNPHLEPRQIKQLSKEYMTRIFQEEDPSKIDLVRVLKIADAQNEMPRYLQEYTEKVDMYSDQAITGALLIKELQKHNFPNSNLTAITKKAEDFMTIANKKLETYKAHAHLMQEKLSEVQALDPQTLAALRTTYMELSNNKFSKTSTLTATGEKMKIKFVLTPLDSMQRLGMKAKTTPVEVGVYGGLRVKASVGLSFGQFFSRPQQFFVRDSILQSSNKDAFSPILTSFIHFYAPSKRTVSLAGSFGVGFPIAGGETLQSVSFFLGPSLVFGKNERIVMSTGVMGGKVDRLSQGYELGDNFYSDSNVAPTISVYELGFYLGVSFNLTGG